MKLVVSIVILLLSTISAESDQTAEQQRQSKTYDRGGKTQRFESFFGDFKLELEDLPNLEEFKTDFNLDDWFSETTIGSGDFISLEKVEYKLLGNQTREDEMQNIMKMIFGGEAIVPVVQEVNGNSEVTVDKAKSPPLPELLTNENTKENNTDKTENKQRRENMPQDGNIPSNAVLNRIKILKKVNEMLNEKKNVSFEIVNGNSVLIHTIDKISTTIKPGDKMDYGDIDQMTTTTEKIIVTTTIISQVYAEQLEELIADGFLKKEVIYQIESGETTIAEIKAQLMKNREFIISRFPPRFTTLFETDQVPKEIEEKIFGGNMTLSQVKYEVYQNDKLAKAMLPQTMRDILESRVPPQEIKDMLYEGCNDSYINNTVRKNDTLLEAMMSDSMYYFYVLFKNPRNVALNMALSGTAIVALVCVMTSLGCTMTVEGIVSHVKRPKGVIIALISQYGIMPAAAFGLTMLFKLDVYPAIAVLICGCCPGGNLSNMLAFAINGDMNLSILMTTCSSVLGLGMMPLLLYCYSRFIIPIDSGEIIPFDKIIINVALTIFPVSLGLAIRRFRPGWTTNVMRFGAVMLLLCSIAFATMAGFLLGDKFFVFFPISVVACAAILPMTGYILGFIFARVARENQKCCRTICVETGCQNVQLCGTILKLAFDPILVGVMILLPIIYMAFQATEALLLVLLYRLYERCSGKSKGDVAEEDIEFKVDEVQPLSHTDSENKIPDKSSDIVNGNAKEKQKFGETKISNEKEDKKANDADQDEATEKWPLTEPKPEYLNSFQNPEKENYV